MPSAALFDIGNVILFFDFGKAARKIESLCPFSAEEIFQKVQPLTPPLERGELTPGEFFDHASQRIGYQGDRDFLRESFEDIFELNQPVVDWIEELDADGVPLFLLSNTNGIHVPFFESNYEVFSRFQGRIYSHEVGTMKPDREIYRITIETLGIDPAQTIYIDDLPENCEAGIEAGLQALHYDPANHAAIRQKGTASVS